ncbi:MAG: hypothetical protein CME62_12770 [Halobacteriovoraceae bacterium]|nr:hypothetical protein [Halobacteriovoraceae bacterium]|tara:strand:+ start:12232 stop:12951 length:720 start_codon:yes stop_codon:yes gene_type:complete
MELVDILAHKYSIGQMHNLYVLEANRVDYHHFLSDFTHQLLTKIIKQLHSGQSVTNHQDILQVNLPEGKKSYLVEQIQEIIKFLNFRPTELSRKFVIMDDAHALSIIGCNKLLKTWEEPEVKATFILLNPYRSELLPTLKSRSITIRVPIEKKAESHEIDVLALSQMSFHKFCEVCQEENYSDYQILGSLYQKLVKQNLSVELIDDMQSKTQELSTLKEFNSSQNTKLFTLYQLVRELK